MRNTATKACSSTGPPGTSRADFRASRRPSTESWSKTSATRFTRRRASPCARGTAPPRGRRPRLGRRGRRARIRPEEAKLRDLLPHAVLEHLDLVGAQVADQVALAVANHEVEHDQVDTTARRSGPVCPTAAGPGDWPGPSLAEPRAGRPAPSSSDTTRNGGARGPIASSGDCRTVFACCCLRRGAGYAACDPAGRRRGTAWRERTRTGGASCEAAGLWPSALRPHFPVQGGSAPPASPPGRGRHDGTPGPRGLT